MMTHHAPAPLSSRTSDTYLESIVQTATPARLRLMLIERAIDVAGKLELSWRDAAGPESNQSGADESVAQPSPSGTNEYSVTLLDLLNELLSGVVSGSQAQEQLICRQVADLYVFLIQHLVEAEQNRDRQSIDEITAVLHVEAETWRAVCAQEGTQPATIVAGPTAAHVAGINLEA